MKLPDVLTPNKAVPKATMQLVVILWVIGVLLWWIAVRPPVVPGPGEVLAAFGDLWSEDALLYHLGESYSLNLWTLFYSSIIAYGLAYLSVVPVMKPIVGLYSKFRFNGMQGFMFVFGLIWAQRSLQISLLTFGVTVFFVTSMVSVVASVPDLDKDYARTLRMGEWEVTWHAVVRSTLDQAIDMLRQNAAIGWMMLTTVETLVRSEGGVGVLLADQNRHFKLAKVFAIQLTILCVGLLQDLALVGVKRMLCPWSFTKKFKKTTKAAKKGGK